jgi:putative DNA primase/helicase
MNAAVLPFPKSSDARRFLDALGDGPFCFRTIPEARNASGQARKYDTFDEGAFVRDNANGCGVFLVVGKGGDKDAEITVIRAVFLDLDRKRFTSDADFEQALRFAHEGRRTTGEPAPADWPNASLIVRSGGGGAHLYWLLLADDCLTPRFKPVQQALAKRFNSDPSVCNPSRLMRLPGTLHCKQTPTPVRLVLCRPERRYKLDDLLNRLGVKIELAAPNETPLADAKPETPENFADVQGALSAIPADCDRGTWLHIGFAIRSLDWQCGRELFLEWSLTAPHKFDQCDFDKLWDGSLPQKAGGITVATLFHIAKQHGYGKAQEDCPDVTSDDGLACRYATYLNERAMHARGQWYKWIGAYWRPDKHAVESELKAFAEGFAQDAFDAWLRNRDGASEKYVLKGAKSLLATARQKAVLESLRVMLTVPGDKLDADPMLLATPNGQVDLRTGALRPADPDAYQTRCAGVAYDPDAQCPTFERFLSTIFCGDKEIIAFVQRWFGYCLTGSMVEEKMLFGYGQGKNGKTVLANVMQHILGSYAVTGDASTLLDSRRDAGSASPDLARLAGARLCLMNESSVGAKLSDGMVKRLVSNEPMLARRLYTEPFSFLPSAKIFLRSNHKPTVRDDSDGFWRRLLLLPFVVQITDAQDDPHLLDKLKSEGPGILAWAVRGCCDWQQQRLDPPGVVQEATAAYRSDSDRIADWLDARTEGGGWTSSTTLRDDYARYAQLRSPPTPHAFAQLLKDRGIEQARTKQGKGFRITLKL